MRLFVIRLTIEKQSGLRKMVAEAVAANADFVAVNFFLIRVKTAVFRHRLKRTPAAERVRFIRDSAFVNRLTKL